MTFKKELKFQTLVLLSKKPNVFNPAEFNQYWLDANKVLLAKDINKNSIFSPQAIQVLSEKFNLIITPEQIQVAGRKPEDFKSVMLDNIQSLVANMEDVKLAGLGLNLNWFIMDSKLPYTELTKKFFHKTNDPGAAFFEDTSTMYGSYYSKQVSNSVRLKLNINPANLFDALDGKTHECIHFAFNFHSDLIEESQREEVTQILADYDKWYNISQEIMNKYN